MSTTSTQTNRYRSIGIDANDLQRYSDTETLDEELLIFDEYEQDAWVQCDFWVDAGALA